jgi:hypothetical protein
MSSVYPPMTLVDRSGSRPKISRPKGRSHPVIVRQVEPVARQAVREPMSPARHDSRVVTTAGSSRQPGRHSGPETTRNTGPSPKTCLVFRAQARTTASASSAGQPWPGAFRCSAVLQRPGGKRPGSGARLRPAAQQRMSRTTVPAITSQAAAGITNTPPDFRDRLPGPYYLYCMNGPGPGKLTGSRFKSPRIQ